MATSKRGFASMPPEKRRTIARKGGKTSRGIRSASTRGSRSGSASATRAKR